MSYSLVEQKIKELKGALDMVSDNVLEVGLEHEDFMNLSGHLYRKFNGLMVVGETTRLGAFSIAGVTVRDLTPNEGKA